MTRSAAQIRQDFIRFFEERGHTYVHGASVVPHDDPTLLFTNAGMNQFKPLFLGTADRGSAFGRLKRAVNSQPCIRAGGKHNDLDDVGHDTYHHTFFEMLGNWSFGDYFKKEAIAWAWELLTEVWKIDPERLHATYFGGDEAEGLAPDDEARELWAKIIAPARIHAGNKKDNFWEMGDTGPCGPCSELHIDLTPDKSGGALVNAGDARVMEIWNLVFIQFNRGPDGKLTPLPAKHVDTGMGLERVSAVLQGHYNNYATDVFTPILQMIERMTGHQYGASVAAPPLGNRYAVFAPSDMKDVACRVIADHIRTLTFAISDGAAPDSMGRGYVLRRILRRAVRYGWQNLALREPFLCKLAPTVVETMGAAFPKLREHLPQVVDILRDEEQSFARTLDRGIALFEEAAQRAAGATRERVISGADAFKLHDTYGFPIDLTQIMAQERGLTVDLNEYERRMEEARERARGGERDMEDALDPATYEKLLSGAPCDDSLKYVEPYECKASLTTLATFSGGVQQRARQGDEIIFTTNRTPFYAEQGGQVSDTGTVVLENGAEISVRRVERRGEHVLFTGAATKGDVSLSECRMRVDRPRRERIQKNHTATHILNWSLREALGEHVQQKGSLVDPDKTRFDFSHPKPLSADEIQRIESLCREQITRNLTVFAQEAPQADALKINGLRAVFGEKYPDRVRVVSIGADVSALLKNPSASEWRAYSIEFCGGTHVKATGEIEDVLLTAEEAVAKGIRRVVGVTGEAARAARARGRELLQQARAALSATEPSRDRKGAGAGEGVHGARTSPGAPARSIADVAADINKALAEETLGVLDRAALREILASLQQALKEQHKQASAASADETHARVDELLPSAERIGETTILVAGLPEVGVEQLKSAADRVKQKCKSAAVFFGVWIGRDAGPGAEQKALLLAAVSDDLVKRGVKAGDWVKAIAPLVQGGGGGPPTMAQAGGKDPAKLGDALAAAKEWIRGKLA